MEKNCEELVVKSPEEMTAVANKVAGHLTGGQLLLLYGDLGAGKTTFVQALAKALGITHNITSPTFTVVAEYDLLDHQTIRRLVHVDLYRLEKPDHLIEDVLQQAREKDTITCIEWAEKLPQEPKDAIKIRFAHGENEGERKVTICYPAGDTI